MNDYLLSIVLGIVEGLTEFLPVSSTAHIRLVLGAYDHTLLESGYWKMYSVVIQLGAILSVLVYFRKRIVEFLKTFPKGPQGDKTLLTHPLSLVMVTFFVTALPALALSKVIKSNLESLYVMGFALLIGGIVMWVLDVRLKNPTTLRMDDIKLPQAVIVGVVQILSAVFPGTSRSMSSIVGGQIAGLSRPAALEFSFFVSIPIMMAACLFDLKDSIGAPAGDPAYIEGGMTAHRWGVLGVGFAVSFVVALLVIHWFMGWVRKNGFVPFAIYRIILGLIVLAWAAGYIGQTNQHVAPALPATIAVAD